MRPILILRPEPSASATRERALALGLVAQGHPLFEIIPVPWTMPAGEFDGLLLTSANTVRHAGHLPPLPVHAVGESTAAAARAAGLEVASVGEGGVKKLLSRLPKDLRLLHPAGEERMPTPADRPITDVVVYRAEPLPDPPVSLVEGAVLLVHSPAAGRRVASFPCRRMAVRIAAISAAAVQACGDGWDRIAAASRPTDDALLSLAAELCKD